MKQDRNKIRGFGRGKERVIYAPYIDTPKKVEPLNWLASCIANGEENNYSEKIENLIEHSINSSSTSNLFKRFLIGQGDPDLTEKKANKDQNFNELIEDIAEEYKDSRPFHSEIRIETQETKWKRLE
jgi:hypothetical protein